MIGDPIKVPYSPTQYNLWKDRIGQELYENALDTVTIASNPRYTAFITKYVETEMIDKKASAAILGKTFKLTHINLDSGGRSLTYPIVTVYEGHFMVDAIIFIASSDGGVAVKHIEVNPSKIIIL